VALPEFRDDGWLPEGHHACSWEEVVAKFGGHPGSQRERVLRGLLDWRDRARDKGVSGWLVLNGSFVSAKENPSDFDTIFVFDDEASELMENDVETKRLLDYSNCKSLGFDMLGFSATLVREHPEWVPLDAFDRDKDTGKPKGVLEVVL
jgi:hypothetical protein